MFWGALGTWDVLWHAPIWGDGGKRLWGHLGLAMPLIPLNPLQERDSSLTLGARGNKCRDSCMAMLSEDSGCRNAGYPSFQGHLEGEEAGSHGHDCFRNYITAEAHPGPSLPAAGVPEEERVLGIWGSRNRELFPEKKAWPGTGAREGQETPP